MNAVLGDRSWPPSAARGRIAQCFMGLSLFTRCSCLGRCDAGVAMQLEEMVLTLQSKITIAIFFKERLALAFIYPKQLLCFVHTYSY